jgi:tetratricopeptide (TPR) repeat protein
VSKQEKKKNEPVRRIATEPKVQTKLWQKPYFFELIVFLFSFLLFANSIPNNYNLDDELVTINHRLTSKGVSAIPEIFKSPYYQDESGYSYEYRPIVLVSFAIEHQIFGDNPHVSHFWNVLLYALACVLLFKLLKLLFKGYSPLFSLGIVLLYAAYPTHTEVVSSIKNRDEILGLIFSILSFYWALRSVRDEKIRLLIFVPLFFALSLLSKLTFMSFVVIIPLALILFSEVGLLTLLITASSLSITLALCLSVGANSDKYLSVIGGVGIALLLYCIKNFAEVKAHAYSSVAFVFDRRNYGFAKREESQESFAQSIRPPFSSFSIASIAINLVLVAIFFASIFYRVYFLEVFVGISLAILINTKNEGLSWLSTAAAYILITINFYYDGFFFNWYFICLFFIPIVYNMVYGRRSLFIPGLMAIMLVIVVGFIKKYNDDLPYVPLIIFLMLYLQRYRFGWIAIILGIYFRPHFIFSFDALDLKNNTAEFIVSKIDFALLTIFVLTVYFKKQHFNLSKAYLIFAISISIIWHPKLSEDRRIIGEMVTTVKAINVKTGSKTENRPILYVENCIDQIKTSQSIKAGTSMEILWHYLTKTILPYPLSFYYGYSFIKPMKISDPIPVISLIAYGLLFLIASFYWRRNSLISFGILFYMLSIAPFSNYFIPAPGMIADRFLLLPSLGWVIILTMIIFAFFKVDIRSNMPLSNLAPAPKYVFTIVLLAYSSLTFSRNFYWKDHVTLFEHDISYVDQSSQAHNLLAIQLMRKSFNEGITPADQLEMRKKAAIHLRRAIEIYPPFFNATYDLGRVYQTIGEADSAIVYYKKTWAMDSTFGIAALAVADMVIQRQRPEEAAPYLKQYITLYPQDYTGYDKLSYSLFIQKDYNAAAEVLRTAIGKLPPIPQPYIGLAKVYHNMNKDDSTRYYLQEALRIDPNSNDAKNLLNAVGK